MRKAGAGAMDDGARVWIEGLLAGSPVARSIGLRFREIAPDRVVAELPFSTGNVTVGDIVHGGVIATLIDVAGAAASASGVGKGEATGGATSTLAIFGNLFSQLDRALGHDCLHHERWYIALSLIYWLGVFFARFGGLAANLLVGTVMLGILAMTWQSAVWIMTGVGMYM